MLQNALLLALKAHKVNFIQLLLDKDYGGELEFQKFLTIKRLWILHEADVTIIVHDIIMISMQNSAPDKKISVI